MEENEQILLFIKLKGDCIGHHASLISYHTCHGCIADTFCKPEDDLDIYNTRLDGCIRLGLMRGVLTLADVFELML